MQDIIIKTLIGLSIPFIILISFAYCDDEKASPKDHSNNQYDILIIGITTSDRGFIARVAKQQRFYQQNGLNVQINEYITGTQIIEKLNQGLVDIAFSNGFVFVK